MEYCIGCDYETFKQCKEQRCIKKPFCPIAPCQRDDCIGCCFSGYELYLEYEESAGDEREKKTTEVENVRSIPLKAGNNTVYLEITTDKGVKDYNFTINKKYYIELSFKIGRRWVETLKILSGDRVLDEDIPIPQKSARYKFNNWIWPNPSRIFHENTTIEADYEETKPHLVIWYLLEREKATADYTILDFEEYHFTNIPSSPYTVKLFDGDETDESFNRAQEVTVKTFEGYELNREESRFWAELDNYEASTWCVLYYDKVHS